MDVIQIVADRISRLITQRGYASVERFAYENGLDKSALSKIIKGQRRPRFDTMVRIAEALDATLNDFYLPEGSLRVSEKGEIKYSAAKRAKSPRVKPAAR